MWKTVKTFAIWRLTGAERNMADLQRMFDGWWLMICSMPGVAAPLFDIDHLI